MRPSLTDQLRELIGVASDRGYDEAAEVLKRRESRRIVFHPDEAGSTRFDPVEEIFFQWRHGERQ
jgi:hypothetical protein